METIEGTVNNITFVNEENGYTVAKLLVPGHSQPVTVVGMIAAISEGELLRCTGSWERSKYGEQFRVESYESLLPTTEKGILKYLSSGLIGGIGEVFARRIVQKFGRETLDIIDHNPERLREVEGIGPKRLQSILEAWEEQKGVRNIIVFLQGCGISINHAIKIYQKYGKEAVAEVKRNPYQLATDIPGIGFLTADRIAINLGFELNSVERAQAGIVYALERAAGEEGHCYLPVKILLQRASGLLRIDADSIIDPLKRLVLTEVLIFKSFNPLEKTPFKPVPSIIDAFFNRDDVLESEDEYAIYLRPLAFAEENTATTLRKLLSLPGLLPKINTVKAIQWVGKEENIKLSEDQKEAIRTSLESKVSIITGGPGTGKTTLINCIVRILRAKNASVRLAAPTGRAAKRLSEVTGEEASTIHRLLEYSPGTGDFNRNDREPLECDALIVDEVSMIDVYLMSRLVEACADTTSIIFVGDVDQLPSVGPGNVLRDLINSNVISTVRLKYIFRQDETSMIVENAHRINRGLFPKVDSHIGGKLTDFYFIESSTTEKTLSTIKNLISERIPDRFGLHPVWDIQVLSPIHKGDLGVENLNIMLQDLLNPHGKPVQSGQRGFRIGDKVMQIKNNYVKEVFNGDMGEVTGINDDDNTMSVDFQNRVVPYRRGERDEIVLAYAASIHKSQGCEYPAVVVPIVTQHYVMLQRNLLYTAVTRAKQLVVLIGTRNAVNIAVKNDRTDKRYTRLEERIRGLMSRHI